MTFHHPGTLGVSSVISAVISFCVASLPVVQWIAAGIAIVAGLLSIYKWWGSNDSD